VNTPSSSASPARLPSLLKSKQHTHVADWDDHLEDLGARWLDNGDVELELSEKEIERNVQLKKAVAAS
jgi:putative intracellular protease/amidase